MTNRIVTIGATGCAISTVREAGEGIREWIVRHANTLDGCSLSGDVLSTTCFFAIGPLEFATHRGPEESDENFKDRHIDACPVRIGGFPPTR